MSGSGNVWDAFRDVLRLQEKVERLDTRVVSQQANVERVNMDVAQLKMTVTILLSQAGVTPPPKPPFDPPGLPD